MGGSKWLNLALWYRKDWEKRAWLTCEESYKLKQELCVQGNGKSMVEMENCGPKISLGPVLWAMCRMWAEQQKDELQLLFLPTTRLPQLQRA